MRIFYGLMMATLVMASCNNDKKTAENSDSTSNPFFQKSKLDYQAPDFDKIKDEDFEPAMLEGILLCQWNKVETFCIE